MIRRLRFKHRRGRLKNKSGQVAAVSKGRFALIRVRPLQFVYADLQRVGVFLQGFVGQLGEDFGTQVAAELP